MRYDIRGNMFAQTVTAYQTIKFKLSKWSVFESMTFKK